MNPKQSPSLAMLMVMFPGQVNINFLLAAKALGLAEQTAYNQVSPKNKKNKKTEEFPVKTFKIGRRRVCSILDLAAVLDAQRGMGRPGRPTNLERVARQSESAPQ